MEKDAIWFVLMNIGVALSFLLLGRNDRFQIISQMLRFIARRTQNQIVIELVILITGPERSAIKGGCQQKLITGNVNSY